MLQPAAHRRCIAAVTPLEDHVLQVDFLSGGRLLLPMKRWLDTLRFAPLRREELWMSAATDGRFVRFGTVEISHDELMDMAEYGQNLREQDGMDQKEDTE